MAKSYPDHLTNYNKYEGRKQMNTVTEVKNKITEWKIQHRPVDTYGRIPTYFPYVNGGSAGDRLSLVPMKSDLIPESQARKPLGLLPHAEKQYCKLIGYPTDLLDRLSGKINMIAMEYLILNEQSKEKDVMLRTIDDTKCRAILSTRYEPFDNLELIEMIEPYAEGSVVRWEINNDLVFHLTISFPSTSTEIAVGDIVERGLHISNSEVGLRSVTIAGSVYRLKCKNGLILKGNDGGFFQFRHLNDPDKMRERVKSAVDSCLLEASGEVERLRQSFNIKVEDSIDFIKEIGDKNELTEDMVSKIMSSWGDEPGNSLFHVVNAVTSTARDIGDPEKSYELQMLGSKLLKGGV